MSDEGKVKGSVASEQIFKDSIRRENLLRLNWSFNWQWYIDLLREREKKIKQFLKSSPKALAVRDLGPGDERTVLPFPVTTYQDYGWLSTRKEFQLEVYGSYYTNTKLTMNPPDGFSVQQSSSDN